MIKDLKLWTGYLRVKDSINALIKLILSTLIIDWLLTYLKTIVLMQWLNLSLIESFLNYPNEVF